MILKKNSIFTVDAFHVHVDGWKSMKKEILSLVDFDNKDAKREKNLTYTDFNLYATGENISDSPYKRLFIDLIHPILSEFRNTVFKYEKIEGPWCQRYEAGDWHSAHDHGPRGYSAVFYAKMNPDVHDSTMFTCPFPTEGSVGSISPNVREGDLVIFPSFLLHTAPPHKSDEDRIVFSFNLL